MDVQTQPKRKVHGANIVRFREEKGWSQSQLSAHMSTRPHPTSISDWERDKYPPSTRHLLALAEAFDKPESAFTESVGGDDDDEEDDAMAFDLARSLRNIIRAETKRVRKGVKAGGKS